MYTLTFNGINYPLPSRLERGWSVYVNAYFQSLAQNALSKNGGAFTLANDVDFGSNKGLTVAYLTTKTASPAHTGMLRLAHSDAVTFRNLANDGDLTLDVNASDRLTFNGQELGSQADVTALTGRVTTAEAEIDALQADVIVNTAAIATKLDKTDGTATGLKTTDALSLAQIATPTAPGAGLTAIYSKSDGKVYKCPNGGVEAEIGSGGLLPVVRTASFTAAANEENQIDHTVGTTIVATLLSTSAAVSCKFVHKAGTVDTVASFLRFAFTDPLDYIDNYDPNDNVDVDWSYYAVTLSKAAGSHAWVGDWQLLGMPNEASLTNSGIVTTSAQSFAGDKTFTGKVSSSNITGGRFIPAVAADANGTALSAEPMLWSRNQNIVTCSGRINLTVTTGSYTPTQLRMTLPVASVFTLATDLAGVLDVNANTGQAHSVGSVIANVAQAQAQFNFNASVSGALNLFYSFQYEVK